MLRIIHGFRISHSVNMQRLREKIKMMSLNQMVIYHRIIEVFSIYIIKSGVCGHSNVPTLTSPPMLKLWDTQGYLWLPYDLTEVIKLFGVTFKQKNIFFSKKYFMSFLPH